ncbi:Hypothetical_protein [Hexamita inflata]|uniref:Hypothetical_protein n=1 Tax=Hexamita inflata TaxID=28002 RepID=A0AA86QUI3_9EUKA|nr:Hypothetical protein HINF_LOCUS52048 [Hexamita inflata]
MSFQYGGQVDGFKQASGINHQWTIEQYLNEAQGDISNAMSIFLRKIAEFCEATSSNEVQAKILLNKDYDVAIAAQKYRESVAGFKQASGINHPWTIEQYLNETEYNISNAMQILQSKISEFRETTSSNEQEARKFLEFDYDVAIAVEKYFVEQEKQQQQNQKQSDENEETLIAKFMSYTDCSKDLAKQYLNNAYNDINIALNKHKIDKQNRDKNVPNQTQVEYNQQNVNLTQSFNVQPLSEERKNQNVGFFGQKKEKKQATYDEKYIYKPDNENNVPSQQSQEPDKNFDQNTNSQENKCIENLPKQETYSQQSQNWATPQNNFVPQQGQTNVPITNTFKANPAQYPVVNNFGQQQNQTQNIPIQNQQSFQPNSPQHQPNPFVQQSNYPAQQFPQNLQAPTFVPNQFNQNQNVQPFSPTQQFQPINQQQFGQPQTGKQFQPNINFGNNQQVFSPIIPTYQVPNNQFNQQGNKVNGTIIMCVVYDGNKALIFLQQQLKMFQEQFLVNHQIETLNDSDILSLTVQEQYFEQVKKALIALHTQESLLHQQRKNEEEIKQRTEKELDQLKQDNDRLQDQIKQLNSEKDTQNQKIQIIEQQNQKLRQEHNGALMNLSQQVQQNEVLLQEVQNLRAKICSSNQMQPVNPQMQIMSPQPQIQSPQPFQSQNLNNQKIIAVIDMQTQPLQIQAVGNYLVGKGANVQLNGTTFQIQYTPSQAPAIEQAMNEIVSQLQGVRRLQ